MLVSLASARRVAERDHMAEDSFLGGGDWAGLGLSLALGMLVGIQRGWAQRSSRPGSQFAGVRTFALFGLAGGISGSLFRHSPLISMVVMAGAAALSVVGYVRTTAGERNVSGTGSLVAIMTSACGFLAGEGDLLPASAIAVTMVLILALRDPLHRAVSWLSEEDVRAIAQFALFAMVILPLLPDRQFGPFEAWNPRQLWMVIVLVSGFSLAGYIVSRLLGPRLGTIATAAAGSMVSSTAVTAALAQNMREESVDESIARAAIAVASVVMFLRVTALAALLAPVALANLAMLAAPGALVSLAASVWFLTRLARDRAPDRAGVPVRNPFALLPAFVLTGMVMLMTVVARWVLDEFGDRGVALVLAISGTVDVDSAVITLGNLPRGTLAPHVAGLVLLAPVVLNTLFKAATTVSIAGWQRGWPAALPLVLSAAACLPGAAWVLR